MFPHVTKLEVVIAIEPDEDGFHAFCPTLKGLHVGGSTIEEALSRAIDAARVYLESMKRHGEPIPIGPRLVDGSIALPQIPSGAVLHNAGVSWPSQ